MLNLTTTSEIIRIITSSAATVDVHASWVDYDGTVVTPGSTNTAISSAMTTTVVAAPAASTYRNVKTLNVRNTHASTSDQVTIQIYNGTTAYQLENVTLLGGERIAYVEGQPFTVFAADGTPKLAPGRLDAKKYVTSDYVNATTSFTDITGLTVAVESGKHYNFEAHLFHRSDATTSGSQFGINGPAMTLMSLNAIQQITSSVTAAAYGSSAAVTALETAAVVETTGPGANTFLAILSGYINPSAAGTFAMRGKSEVAVAAGLTVKKGSWLRIWEADA